MLPVIYRTVSPLATKDRGLLDCLHDAVILLVEGDDLHDLVHLVPHLALSSPFPLSIYFLSECLSDRFSCLSGSSCLDSSLYLW